MKKDDTQTIVLQHNQVGISPEAECPHCHQPLFDILGWARGDILEEKCALEEKLENILQWQPITSVPEDGSYVLGWFPGTEGRSGLVRMMQATPANVPSKVKVFIFKSPFENLEREDLNNPTHWIPLPTPPRAAKRSQ